MAKKWFILSIALFCAFCTSVYSAQIAPLETAEKLRMECTIYTNANDSDSPLISAIQEHNTSTVRRLLHTISKDSIHTTNKHGVTPLIIAVKNKDISIAQTLLCQGANIHAIDPMGNTPLMYAVLFGHIEMVDLLIEHGANKQISNYFGDTPLSIAEEIQIQYRQATQMDPAWYGPSAETYDKIITLLRIKKSTEK